MLKFSWRLIPEFPRSPELLCIFPPKTSLRINCHSFVMYVWSLCHAFWIIAVAAWGAVPSIAGGIAPSIPAKEWYLAQNFPRIVADCGRGWSRQARRAWWRVRAYICNSLEVWGCPESLSYRILAGEKWRTNHAWPISTWVEVGSHPVFSLEGRAIKSRLNCVQSSADRSWSRGYRRPWLCNCDATLKLLSVSFVLFRMKADLNAYIQLVAREVERAARHLSRLSTVWSIWAEDLPFRPLLWRNWEINQQFYIFLAILRIDKSVPIPAVKLLTQKYIKNYTWRSSLVS